MCLYTWKEKIYWAGDAHIIFFSQIIEPEKQKL